LVFGPSDAQELEKPPHGGFFLLSLSGKKMMSLDGTFETCQLALNMSGEWARKYPAERRNGDNASNRRQPPFRYRDLLL
jgi:hypothetical protein